ncbi:MAG: potassium transport protein Kup [Methanoregula sp. PtaU1.Bin006]|uniref:KUP/HAK/KT family potassium transporter n=1 Tax=Methanoregula sp. PtaU1.Bin006 TaxID=1811681 RepID=UPI0009CB0DE4|nr:KUP/HAK/KT family potassium transporter [Methanoregula sp. PtaU1.Bin006]OPY32853.1 MAG: potassium transport protein Kup [Methanoregula sp. PtaU1.Bin006]
MNGNGTPVSRIVRSLGLVFGDIGTSPIYTIGAILLFILPTTFNMFGLLSLITWTLFTIITIQYIWLAMSLSDKGEGGTIVLKTILDSVLTPGITASAVSVLTLIGIALFIGDGVITPAISILSAVEGIRLIPGFEETGGITLLFVAALIATGLFFFQKRGTDRVAWAFGPVMAIWFFSLALFGVISIIGAPQVLFALSPVFAFEFILENGWTSLIVMSAVILCITGGEALYADMGHLGREPIVKGWIIVFPALVLSYLGQGAYVIMTNNTHNVLFSMINHLSPLMYVPFLILSIAATVIASQAMISGMFSIVYQGMNTRLLPKMKVEYTSTEMQSQIYIGAVNWMLLAAVLVVIFEFRTSENLASAYGLAVSGSMVISALMMAIIFLYRKEPARMILSVALIIVDGLFFISTLFKIPHGAFWSFILAAIPLIIIVTFILGQEKLHAMLRPVPVEEFLPRYREIYTNLPKVRGTALYFVGNTRYLSPYISQVFFQNEILYENNILVSIRVTEKPFGISTAFESAIAPGLHIFTITAGYTEIVNVAGLLKERSIEEKTIFYGVENIVSDDPLWKLYGIIKKISPPFVQFYTLPPEKIHGVVTRVVM